MLEPHARAGESGTEIMQIDGTLFEYDPEDVRRATRLTL